MKKICLFGDSISKGIVVDSLHNRYMTTKHSFANIISAGTSTFDLANYSMLGCTINKGKSLIQRHKKTVEGCDVMVLEYGGNDSDHNWEEISLNPDYQHKAKTPIEDFAICYQEIIEQLSRMDKKILMLNLPPIDENKYLDWFSRGLDKDNILKWLGGSADYIYEFHESYNNKVCSIAAENGIRLIDIRSAFLELGNYSDCLCEDGIHPNEKGHDLIAEVIRLEMPQLTKAFTENLGA
ncbi:MAG: SGNH/GDSL hydrolase family protein [Clostridiales bacterium]|nr:SGNH/GDSL hydrolase family protein [Clostridiales bacterium]